MLFSKFADRKKKLFLFLKSFWIFCKARIATLVFLGFLSSFLILSIAWYLEINIVSNFFAQLNIWQQNPPEWLETPQFNNQFSLYFPAIFIFIVVQIITRISTRSNQWSRVIMIAIQLALTLRYLFWRSLSSLNLSNPTDGMFSLLLLGFELIGIVISLILFSFLIQIKDRHQEANNYSQEVLSGEYLPSVDILIPTYNEPDFILKRSIIGCQALNYNNKKIYVLDETKRPEIQKLCEELNCFYLTRPDNLYAKAGNLNHALSQTNGELIVVFDADFVPTTNFLTRTVGFFQNPKIGLVQTPQSFYNTDAIAKNLGLGKILTSDDEIFYRQVQIMKDSASSVICSGTSFVMRRGALKEVGNFVTDSLSEDYFTGIEISAKGYELVYLPEKLSAGLAAETIGVHIAQRARWGRGTLQAFFINSNPLTISGLNFKQRLAHLEGLLNWFNLFPRIIFLLIPFLYTFFQIVPFKITSLEIIYFFLPYYLMQVISYRWFNDSSRSIFFSEIYSLVGCIALNKEVIKTLINPFDSYFKVTPKGLYRKNYSYDWNLAFPLIVFLILTLVSFYANFITSYSAKIFNVALFWNIYNLIILIATLYCFLDPPKLDLNEWFDVHQKIVLSNPKNNIQGTIIKLSESGAVINIDQLDNPWILENSNQVIQVQIIDQDLCLSAEIMTVIPSNKSLKIKIQFKDLTLLQQRKLIEKLFCQPGTWKEQKVPNEIISLGLILGIFLRPLKFLKQSFLK